VVGFGSAGLGIAQQIVSVLQDGGLSRREAHARFYALDRWGLLVEGMQGLRPEQAAFARARADIANWQLASPQQIGLMDVVRNAKPTVLIGVSGQPGAFTEEAIRLMAQNAARPVIFPLSNPTSRCEATPQQIVNWTEGRALMGTGSPFGPVMHRGQEMPIDQTNNSYIFPGLALGILSAQARHVSDGMIKAAALALASLSPTRQEKQARLLPPLADMRSVSRIVARSVGMRAIEDGLATIDEAGLDQELAANIWEPVYEPYERIES
jgi:malate dehydrogenase (oxaloacetate-decarboxylating)